MFYNVKFLLPVFHSPTWWLTIVWWHFWRWWWRETWQQSCSWKPPLALVILSVGEPLFLLIITTSTTTMTTITTVCSGSSRSHCSRSRLLRLVLLKTSKVSSLPPFLIFQFSIFVIYVIFVSFLPFFILCMWFWRYCEDNWLFPTIDHNRHLSMWEIMGKTLQSMGKTINSHIGHCSFQKVYIHLCRWKKKKPNDKKESMGLVYTAL